MCGGLLGEGAASAAARNVAFDDLFRIEWGAPVEKVRMRARGLREDSAHIAASASKTYRAFSEEIKVGGHSAVALYTFRDARLIDVTIRFADKRGVKGVLPALRERLGKENSKAKGRHRWVFGVREVAFRERLLGFSTREEFPPLTTAVSSSVTKPTLRTTPTAHRVAKVAPRVRKKAELVPLDWKLAELLRLKAGRMMEVHRVDVVDDASPETILVGPVFRDSLETRGVAVIAEKKGDMRLVYRGRICEGAGATLYLQAADVRFEGMKELLIASEGEGGKVVQSIVTLDGKARTARYVGGRLAGEQVFGCYTVLPENHRNAIRGIDFKDIDHDEIAEVRVAYEGGVPSRPDPKIDIYYWQRGGLFFRETVKGSLSDTPSVAQIGAVGAVSSFAGAAPIGEDASKSAPKLDWRPSKDDPEGEGSNPTREFEVVDELVRNGVFNAHDITTAVLRLKFPQSSLEEIQLWPPHGEMPNFGRKLWRWRSKGNAAVLEEYWRVFRELVQPLVMEKMKSEIGRPPEYGRDFRGNLKVSPDGYQSRGLTGTHHGVDYLDHLGTPIQSLYDGVVVKKAYNGGFGNYVVVRTNEGNADNYKLLYYAHQLDDPPVEIGERVRRGQLIGFVGSSGRSAGPHIHLEHHEYRNGKRYRLRHGVDEFKKWLKANDIDF